eukprot:Sspe_Gene.100818::Locus_75469_Transcript_1_1_Confidence_1.000_Length_1301::g.100818::m.100818
MGCGGSVDRREDYSDNNNPEVRASTAYTTTTSTLPSTPLSQQGRSSHTRSECNVSAVRLSVEKEQDVIVQTYDEYDDDGEENNDLAKLISDEDEPVVGPRVDRGSAHHKMKRRMWKAESEDEMKFRLGPRQYSTPHPVVRPKQHPDPLVPDDSPQSRVCRLPSKNPFIPEPLRSPRSDHSETTRHSQITSHGMPSSSSMDSLSFCDSAPGRRETLTSICTRKRIHTKAIYRPQSYAVRLAVWALACSPRLRALPTDVRAYIPQFLPPWCFCAAGPVPHIDDTKRSATVSSWTTDVDEEGFVEPMVRVDPGIAKGQKGTVTLRQCHPCTSYNSVGAVIEDKLYLLSCNVVSNSCVYAEVSESGALTWYSENRKVVSKGLVSEGAVYQVHVDNTTPFPTIAISIKDAKGEVVGEHSGTIP